MAKEDRSERASVKITQDNASAPAPADSRPAGSGGEGDLFYINDKGEYCFGTSCFSMRIKPGAGEVRVIVDRNECGADGQALVDALFGEVVKGAPTVYESKSQESK